MSVEEVNYHRTSDMHPLTTNRLYPHSASQTLTQSNAYADELTITKPTATKRERERESNFLSVLVPEHIKALAV
jgi:hypothetical protein